ncbi:MAG: terminase large subunit domain-containing protein [Nitrospiraceae bacterium]
MRGHSEHLSYYGTPEQLREWKAFIFTNWKVEIRPGDVRPYLAGVNRHPGQTALHFGPEWIYFAAPWGRRCGKTIAAAGEVIYTASFPKTRTWIVGPQYETTDRVWQIVWQALVIEEVLGPGSIEKSNWTRDNRFIRTCDGAIIVGKSAESPTSLKGEQLDLIVVDECAFLAEDIWTEYLEPCTIDRHGRVLFISTPRGGGWFKRYFDRRLEEETKGKGWAGIRCRTEENPYVDRDWLRSKKTEIPEDIFRREYEASFEEFEGLIWPDFSPDYVDWNEPHVGGHVFNPASHPVPTGTTYSAIDIGFRHPTACLWARANRKNDLWVYREYHGAPSTVHDDHAKSIRRLSGQDRIADTAISHDSRRRVRNDSDPGDERTIQDLYAENGVFTNLANTDVLPGIASVSSYLRATLRPNTERPKLFISRNCPRLISALSSYQWARTRYKDQVAPERPFKKDDDLCDALRYLIMMNPCHVDSVHEPSPMRDDDITRYGMQNARARAMRRQGTAAHRRMGGVVMGRRAH